MPAHVVDSAAVFATAVEAGLWPVEPELLAMVHALAVHAGLLAMGPALGV